MIPRRLDEFERPAVTIIRLRNEVSMLTRVNEGLVTERDQHAEDSRMSFWFGAVWGFVVAGIVVSLVWAALLSGGING